MKNLFLLLILTTQIVCAQDKSLDFTELLKAIPTETHGFSLSKEPNGVNLGSGAINYSNASKNYTKDAQKLAITITDYNGFKAMYTNNIGLKDDYYLEDEYTRVKVIRLNGYKAILSYDKKDHEASLIVGIQGRYIIMIVISPVDEESITKTLFDSIDIGFLLQDMKAS